MADLLKLMDALRTGGDRVALHDGTRAWTYRQLDDAVQTWMQRLDHVGAARVGCRLPNGFDWVALDLALLRSGRVAVPVPDFFSAAQERHVLEASGADTYVSDVDSSPAGFQPLNVVEGLVIHGREVAQPPLVHPGTAKITFTSGTTGRPKGVCLAAEQLLATASGVCDALGGRDIRRHLCVLPLSLLLENVAGVYANLLNHSEIRVLPVDRLGLSGSSGLDIQRFVAAQQVHAPESLILVPQLLLALTAAGEFRLGLPDSYRFVAVGGGRVPEQLIARAEAVGIPVYEGYGLTECGSVVTLNLPGAKRPGSVGKPLTHARVSVCDGEIYVAGQTMLGYLGEPPLCGPVATGDLGSFDEDGFLHVRGRKKHCFITAFGRNVSPEWIESELQTEFPIAHAVVFGEALPENVACLVPRGDADEAQLAQAVENANSRLPDYARVGAWRSIPFNEFAAAGCLTDNGRPRRLSVTERFAGEIDSLYAEVKERSYAAIRQA